MKTLALSYDALETIQNALAYRLGELDRRKEELRQVGATEFGEEDAEIADTLQALREVRQKVKA